MNESKFSVMKYFEDKQFTAVSIVTKSAGGTFGPQQPHSVRQVIVVRAVLGST